MTVIHVECGKPAFTAVGIEQTILLGEFPRVCESCKKPIRGVMQNFESGQLWAHS